MLVGVSVALAAAAGGIDDEERRVVAGGQASDLLLEPQRGVKRGPERLDALDQRGAHVANTKHISDRAERKASKRQQRKALKDLYENLTKDQKRRYRKSETKGLRAWLAEQKSDD